MIYQFGLLLIVTYVSATSALPPCICARNMDPVCGTDGNTYNNECLLNCKRVDNPELEVAKRGQCDSEPPLCFCTYEYKPLCGSNGVTYPNKCSMECERSNIEIAYPGECRTKREDVEVAKLRPCECTRDKRPVCGTDGKTYSNPCMLNCAREGNEDLHIDHEGSCVNEVKVVDNAQNVPCSCTRNLAPVCASNGETYNNECLMRCSGTDLTVASDGPCTP